MLKAYSSQFSHMCVCAYVCVSEPVCVRAYEVCLCVSVCLSVCVSVCYHIFGNIVRLYVITTIAINFIQNSLYIYKHFFW